MRLAAVSRDGPGIVLRAAWVGGATAIFRTPGWQDLVIAEAHVRDLTARAPAAGTADERLGSLDCAAGSRVRIFTLHAWA